MSQTQTQLYPLDQLLAEQGAEYLVLDFNHLFISSTLREEVWLLRQQDDRAVVDKVIAEAGEFDIRGVRADRELHAYSGGEQAILACLLILATVEAAGVQGCKLLLYGLLESLSLENRDRLLARLAASHATQGLRTFIIEENHTKEIALGH
jgi:hypothetical protein